MSLSRNNKNFIERKLLFTVMLLFLLLLGACQNEEPPSDSMVADDTTMESNSEIEAESLDVTGEDISFQIDGEDIPSATISECLPSNNCNEESRLHSRTVNVVELTEDIEPIEVVSADPVTINIQGEQPTEISYMVGTGVRIQTKTIDNNKFSIYGEGLNRVLVTFDWTDNEGEFLGTITKGLVLEIN